MTPLETLKNMLPIYHMRNKIECTTPVGNYLCTLNYGALHVFDCMSNNSGKIVMQVSHIHRKRFNEVSIKFYENLFSHVFTVVKRKKEMFLLVYNNKKVLVPMDIEKDEYFNFSMNLNLSFSYEEFKELFKLCSQINHNVTFYL